MYFSAALFLGMLFLALYNSWAFLWKQKKYKTIPLLMFYIVVIALAIMRVYFSIWYFYGLYLDADFFGSLMKPVLNLTLGLIQCWILLELALRINLNIKLTKHFTNIAANQSKISNY